MRMGWLAKKNGLDKLIHNGKGRLGVGVLYCVAIIDRYAQLIKSYPMIVRPRTYIIDETTLIVLLFATEIINGLNKTLFA